MNITFTCVGVGYPPPLVKWRKLNGSLSNRVTSTNMSVLTGEGNVTRVTVELILTKVFREDTGVYECSVSNQLNNVTRNITLIVQCMHLNILISFVHVANAEIALLYILLCYIRTCMKYGTIPPTLAMLEIL